MDDDYELYYRDYDDQIYEYSEPSHYEIFYSCIEPTYMQIIPYMGKFVLWSFIFRITTQTCTYAKPLPIFVDFVAKLTFIFVAKISYS